MSGELQVLLPIEGLVDLEALRGRLEKDLAKAEKEIKGLAGRLANPNFAGKAPPEVVAECRANLAEAEAQAAWRDSGWRIWAEPAQERSVQRGPGSSPPRNSSSWWLIRSGC